MNKIKALPIMQNLPSGVSNEAVGNDKWQQQLITNFIIAVFSAWLWCSRCWCCSTSASSRRW